MTSQPVIFDRIRQRFLRHKAYQTIHHDAFFLHQEVEEVLKDRLSFIKQKFSRVLISGPTSTLSENLLLQGYGQDIFVAANTRSQSHLEMDEEKLPFKTPSFDLIVSFLELQDLNYIPVVLVQNRHLLQSPGLDINAFIGGESFHELRTSLLQAEIDLTQGAKPRVHPMIDVETALKLFTQANFTLPVVDRQFFKVQYRSLDQIFQDLKFLGARNSLNVRAHALLHRNILKRAEEIYKNLFSNEEGELTLTVEVIFLTGWA